MIYYIIYMPKEINALAGGASKMILLSMDVLDLTFNHVVNFLAVGIVLWFIIKNILEVRKAAKEQIVREQGWDNAARIITEKQKEWDDGLADVRGEREAIKQQFDKRLDDLETKINLNQNELENKIDSNKTDTEAKIQELRSNMIILTETMRAVLDGLHQLNCNGKVTEASEKLDAYLVGLVGRG